jgi:c-di-GMP-binding flagellar brake protein YcgR
VDTVAPQKPAALARSSLEDLQLLVGDRLQLEIPADGSRSQHFTPLIGYVKGVSLLVRTPAIKSTPIPVRDGEHVLVRGFSGRSAFSFETAVSRSCLAPLPYLHLAYPAAVQVTAIRDALRVRVGLQGTAQNLDRDPGRVPIACTVADLSVNGAQLESRQILGMTGERLQVFFTFLLQPNGYEVKLSPQASIQTARSIGSGQEEGNTHTYGMRFDNLHNTESLLIQSYVQQTVLTDRSKLV